MYCWRWHNTSRHPICLLFCVCVCVLVCVCVCVSLCGFSLSLYLYLSVHLYLSVSVCICVSVWEWLAGWKPMSVWFACCYIMHYPSYITSHLKPTATGTRKHFLPHKVVTCWWKTWNLLWHDISGEECDILGYLRHTGRLRYFVVLQPREGIHLGYAI